MCLLTTCRFRGNTGTGKQGPPVSPGKQNKTWTAAWGAGLKTSVELLRKLIGAEAPIIGNYGASIVQLDTVGAMMERGGSGAADIKALQQYASEGKVVEYHAQ